MGQAGDIAITSDSLTLNQGNITATSIETGGGDINLVTDSIFLDNNSLISTSVLDSTGGGGNIQITTQGLFLDASSQITASSEFGVDGVIDISELELNKRLNVVQLPQKISTRKALIISNCPVPEANTFAVTGLGGIPENPSSYLRGRTLWQDARRLTDNTDANSLPNTSSNSQHQKTSNNRAIVESQTWIVNQRGNIELVAAVTPQIGQQEIRCGDL
ncbi:MAG: hypothetical protein AAGA16_00430 [Cyanobacteria bacterium P01_E01_bin.35]